MGGPILKLGLTQSAHGVSVTPETVWENPLLPIGLS